MAPSVLMVAFGVADLLGSLGGGPGFAEASDMLLLLAIVGAFWGFARLRSSAIREQPALFPLALRFQGRALGAMLVLGTAMLVARQAELPALSTLLTALTLVVVTAAVWLEAGIDR